MISKLQGGRKLVYDMGPKDYVPSTSMTISINPSSVPVVPWPQKDMSIWIPHYLAEIRFRYLGVGESWMKVTCIAALLE